MTLNPMMPNAAPWNAARPTFQADKLGIVGLSIFTALIGMIRNREPLQMEKLERFRQDSAGDFAILDGFAKTFKQTFGSKYSAIDGVEVPESMEGIVPLRIDTAQLPPEQAVSMNIEMNSAIGVLMALPF